MIKFLLCFFLVVAMPAFGLQNNLAKHASPYLAMHGTDPVHWQDWSPDVLKQAQKEDKIIFISSGYFSCHWCHVMQKESYKNEDIAALINKNFIPVKVDRELQPALDAHLIDFVQRTQGAAGWPLNVFLTPEGYPIFGMTYLPAENFKTLLGKLLVIWDTDRDETRDLARRALLQLVVTRENSASKETITPAQLRMRLEANALEYGDSILGGFGEQNKFPMAPQLKALVALQEKYPDPQLAAFLQLTLDSMAGLGLRDHLAGGFFRYTVDPDWHIPHYEKMLYTQAQLSELYLFASKVFKRPDYLMVAKDTLDFTLQKMQGAHGAYIASFSAVDDKGIEGGFYLWTAEQLRSLLTKDELKVAGAYWHMNSTPVPEDGYLPMLGTDATNLPATLGMSKDEIRKYIGSAKLKLLSARQQRTLPADTKELASWNGLLLGALSQMAAQSGGKSYRKAAMQLRNNLMTRLWDGKQLLRARDGDKALGSAALEDYAYVADGLFHWAVLTGDKKDMALVRQLLNLAWGRYYNGNGWSDHDEDFLPGLPRNKAQEDGALPAAAAMIIKLSSASQDEQLVAKAKAALKSGFATVTPEPFWYASQVLAIINQPAAVDQPAAD